MPIGSTPLRDGHRIPNLAFGTGSALYGHDAQDAVRAALDAGFRHVDTAQAYQNEKSVGDALVEWLGEDHNSRDKLWVTTKYSGGDKGPLQELKDSLKKLSLEYVDLYLIHQPRFVHGNLKGAWREMEVAREQGLARSIGVSNFDATDLEELLRVAKVKPAVNQIRLHPYIYGTSLPTLMSCSRNGIVVEAYGSLFPITQLPDGPVTRALKGPSKRLEASPGQVLFLWARAKGAVVVTTTSKEERLKEYLQIGNLGALTEEEVRNIDEAAQPAFSALSSQHKVHGPLLDTERQDPKAERHRLVLRDLCSLIGVLLLPCMIGIPIWLLGDDMADYLPTWFSRQSVVQLYIILEITCLAMALRVIWRLMILYRRR